MNEHFPEVGYQWIAAVEKQNPDKIIELYHPDAILWGTFSPVIRHGHEAIKDYFLTFMQMKNLRCRFTEGITRDYNDFIFFSGSYEFTFDDKGKNASARARFSFIYRKEEGKMLIMEHHSSLFPEV